MDREYWTKKLREAEAELEAARKASEVKAPSAWLQRAKTELKALDQAKPPGRTRTKRSASTREPADDEPRNDEADDCPLAR
jgi:hypothetical protein